MPKKKKPKMKYTRQERMLYNKYTRKQMQSGGDVSNMRDWVVKQRGKKKKP